MEWKHLTWLEDNSCCTLLVVNINLLSAQSVPKYQNENLNNRSYLQQHNDWGTAEHTQELLCSCFSQLIYSAYNEAKMRPFTVAPLEEDEAAIGLLVMFN